MKQWSASARTATCLSTTQSVCFKLFHKKLLSMRLAGEEIAPVFILPETGAFICF